MLPHDILQEIVLLASMLAEAARGRAAAPGGQPDATPRHVCALARDRLLRLAGGLLTQSAAMGGKPAPRRERGGVSPHDAMLPPLVPHATPGPPLPPLPVTSTMPPRVATSLAAHATPPPAGPPHQAAGSPFLATTGAPPATPGVAVPTTTPSPGPVPPLRVAAQGVHGSSTDHGVPVSTAVPAPAPALTSTPAMPSVQQHLTPSTTKTPQLHHHLLHNKYHAGHKQQGPAAAPQGSLVPPPLSSARDDDSTDDDGDELGLEPSATDREYHPAWRSPEQADAARRYVGRWSDEDTRTLIERAQLFGRDFVRIAEGIEGRSELSCKRKLTSLVQRKEITPAVVAAIDKRDAEVRKKQAPAPPTPTPPQQQKQQQTALNVTK